MKLFNFIKNNILFILTLILLAFIPLYPKLPLIDIRNTWVYIRVEDFIVLFSLVIWAIMIIRKKVILKTPLTIPIMVFWLFGALATIHGMFLVFPNLPDAHSNVGFLSFIRRMEYLSVFFIAYEGIKDKRFIPYVVAVLTATLLLISLYGFGQKYLGFNAYLTTNEEYAKGLAIQLSPLARVPSTFAGQYDLAAYLVLVIPILTSMIFAFKNWFAKIIISIVISLGFILLFLTVSRISFVALIFSLLLVLFFQKKKAITLSLVGITIIFLIIFPSLLDRFASTLKTTDVLVSVKTGEIIGHVNNVSSSYFSDKVIKLKSAQDKGEIISPISSTATTAALIVPIELVPSIAPLVVETSNSTGENLPQGTGYINLPLAPIKEKITSFYYQRSNDPGSSEYSKVLNIHGNYLLKSAVAYDLSFTTRFQGEWPRTIDTFKKNIFIGGGYGSVSLAVDNNYLRILGEIGLLGFLSFGLIFLVVGIYIKKVLPEVESKIARNFILGFSAGAVGIGINALLIDVFEASKIAFSLWLLVGISLGILKLYQKKPIYISDEIKKAIISPIAIVSYLGILVFILYSNLSGYFFIGDDFTWFRWVSDCNKSIYNECNSIFTTILSYFSDSNGFFYRPGTKIYFLSMYKIFWLNQTVYHFVSIFLHLSVAVLIFLISKKLLKNYFFSALSAFLFIIMSGYSESVFWISSTGFLFNAFFVLLSFLFYINWKEKKKKIFLVFSMIFFVLSMFFHELGIVTPLFFVLYEFVILKNGKLLEIVRKPYYLIFLLLIMIYLFLRFQSQSHWFNGDYSYNLLKLPFNFIGNILGYISILLFGDPALAGYEKVREIFKNHIEIASGIIILIASFFALLGKLYIKKFSTDDKKIIYFGALFFIIALLPFLGLGNITSRYSYLSSFGFLLIFVFLLEKLYLYLKNNGKEVSIGILTIVICIFSFWHLMQLQKIHDDWKNAGKKSQGFFLDVDKIYMNYWIGKPLDLYFVNVPIRDGQAWIFPVGLEDAVWFVFHSDLVRVYQPKSLNEALQMSENSLNGKVFEFDASKNIVEKRKRLDGVIVSTPY